MRITYNELEDPSIIKFFILETEGFLPRVRAKPLSETSVNYRTIYVQDYLVSSEGWELLEALAKLLGISYAELDKPKEACRLFNHYLSVKYPTYSYH